ncbi:MAG: peptidase U32 family protein [Bacilli bacterium]|jgi:putative protease
MTKMLIIPNNKADLYKLSKLDGVGFILGIKGFSVFIGAKYQIEELKEVISFLKKQNKMINIAINKIIYNKDIPKLKEYLLILEGLNIDLILYDDVSVVNISQNLNLKTPLGWMNSSFVTNYQTCNYWGQQGVKYALLGNEITLKDKLEIKKKTTLNIMVTVYGYFLVSQSSRSLLSNYFSYFNQEKENDVYQLYDEITKQSYFCYEEEGSSYIYSSFIFNALEEIPLIRKACIEYVVLNGFDIPIEVFLKTINLFREVLFNNLTKKEIKERSIKVDIENNYNTSKGFLYKETIYRVKDNV